MLLILSRTTDPHVRHVVPLLRERNVAYRWIDPGTFPAGATISLGGGADGQLRARLVFDGEPLDLETVSAVWFRRPSASAPVAGSDPGAARVAADISRSVLSGLAHTLRARWLPGTPLAAISAQNKVSQLDVAPRIGFRMPRTLITNDPNDLLAFWEACEGRMVAKQSSKVGAGVGPERWHNMPTHVVRRRDLANYQGLRHAPMLLQEYVPKQLELRVTVVGDRVFSCAIDSQASRVTRHDWRHIDQDRAAFTVHMLPDELAACCIRLVEAYGLCYGAIDLVLTPAGEYIFLELNPMGEWLFVQLATGLPIAQAVVDLLTTGRVRSALTGVPAHGVAGSEARPVLAV